MGPASAFSRRKARLTGTKAGRIRLRRRVGRKANRVCNQLVFRCERLVVEFIPNYFTKSRFRIRAPKATENKAERPADSHAFAAILKYARD